MVFHFADHVCSIGLGPLGPRHLEEEKWPADCPSFRADPHDLGLAKEILRLRAENIVQCAKSGDLDSPCRVMTALR